LAEISVVEDDRGGVAAKLKVQPLSPLVSPICRPTTLDPVNEIIAIARCCAKRSPISLPDPVTTFRTPAGSPASSSALGPVVRADNSLHSADW